MPNRGFPRSGFEWRIRQDLGRIAKQPRNAMLWATIITNHTSNGRFHVASYKQVLRNKVLTKALYAPNSNYQLAYLNH